MSVAPARRFPWKIYLIVLTVIVFVAALPLLSVALTYLIANANSCTVNEAAVHPCVVLGADLGGLLYGMGVMGWLMLATVPLGAIGIGIWLVVGVVHYLVHRAAKTNSGVA